MPCFALWGRRLMLPSSPPQTLSFAEPRGREVTSLEKMLVLTGQGKYLKVRKYMTELEQVLQSLRLGTFWNMFLLGSQYDSFLLRMRKWERILQ
jgi:hypothetical protein